MGTLFDQPPRRWFPTFGFENKTAFDQLAEDLIAGAKKHNLTIDQSIEVARLCEQTRSTNALIDDRDTKDEQLGGFGELIRNFTSAIERYLEND